MNSSEKRRKKRFLIVLICFLVIVGVVAAYLSVLNIGLKGNPLPARAPMFLVKLLLGEPESEKYFDETGRTVYVYEDVNIWGEPTHVSYSGFGFLWVDEIHTSFEPAGDPTMKYNEILSALQKVYTEEPSSNTEAGVEKHQTMRRNSNIFFITLSDTGLISLSLYVY